MLRAMTLGRSVALLIVIAGFSVCGALLLLTRESGVAVGSSCPIGAARPPTVVPEEKAGGIRPTTAEIVLGCGRLDGAGRFRVIAFRLRSPRGQGTLCIDVRFASGYGYGCGDDIVYGGGDIEAGAASTDGRRTQVSGTASSRVQRVRLEYRLGYSGGHLRAKLVRVRDAPVLKRLQIDRPFGYYVGELPARAQRITVRAYDRTRTLLDRARFSDVTPPEPTSDPTPASPPPPISGAKPPELGG
jgi:hypothetical protein